jgi:Calcineurin-like phosphoesterase
MTMMSSASRCALVAALLLLTLSARAEVKLPFGDINVVVVTDVHSFVAGHSKHDDHQPVQNANYGHVLSFVERLKELAPEKDVWFVMNGDFVDGTGISSKVSALTPILERMPWDALTAGDHEMSEDSTIELITQPGGFVQWFGSKYVTSNIVVTSTGEPLGRRYKLLKGKSSTTLVLGFLFEMDYGSTLKMVQPVAAVIRQDWFQELANESFDAVLVLAHMDLHDPLVDTILAGIRQIKGKTMPVQFITGHTHHRGYSVIDDLSTSYEAGRFLDTVGFVSFPKEGNIDGKFQHEFLDANTDVLADTLGIPVESLLTTKGDLLIEFIERTRSRLGLNEVLGCSPAHFLLNISLRDHYSLWGLYKDEVLPTQFLTDSKNKVVIQNKATSLRYDLYKGDITLDDLYIVSPSNESFYLVAQNLPSAAILELNATLNSDKAVTTNLPLLPEYILIGVVEDGKAYDLYAVGIDLLPVQEQLQTQLADIDITPFKTTIGVTQLWHDFFIANWPNCSIIWDLVDDEALENGVAQPRTGMMKSAIGASFVLALGGIAYAIIVIRNQRDSLEFDSDDLLFVTNDGGFRDDPEISPREEGRFA